jgi:hypothetical protein
MSISGCIASSGFQSLASELEQSLIELTRNDPDLQQEFLQTLMQDAGRQAHDTGEGD